METKAIQITRNVLGVLHFVAQSSADLLLEAEASIVSNHSNISKDVVREQRLASTNVKQEKAINNYKELMEKVRNVQAQTTKTTEYSNLDETIIILNK